MATRSSYGKSHGIVRSVNRAWRKKEEIRRHVVTIIQSLAVQVLFVRINSHPTDVSNSMRTNVLASGINKIKNAIDTKELADHHRIIRRR